MEQAVIAGDRYSSVGDISTRKAVGVVVESAAGAQEASRKTTPNQKNLKYLADKGNNQNQSSCGRAIDGEICQRTAG